MIFTQVCEKVDNTFGFSDMEVATEGWGKFAAWALLIPTAGIVPMAHTLASANNAAKILETPAVKKYISSQAKTLWNKEKAKNKNLTIKPSGEFSKDFSSYNAAQGAHDGGRTFRNGLKMYSGFIQIDGFSIWYWYDFNHIEKVAIACYDLKANKPHPIPIPNPSKKDLQEYGYRAE